MSLRNVRFVLPAVVVTGALALAGCAASPPSESASSPSSAPAVAVRDLSTHTVLLDSADPVELALTTSQAVYARSEVVVLADADDQAARPALAATAVAVHAPALLAGGGTSDGGLAEELGRLGARVAIVVTGEDDESAGGEASQAAADAAGVQAVRVAPDVVGNGADGEEGQAGDGGGEGGVDPALEDDDLQDLTSRLDSMLGEGPTAGATAGAGGSVAERGEPSLLREVLALVDPTAGQEAAIASLRAAGAVTSEVPGGDLGTRRVVQNVDRAQALTVVGVGGSFGDAATFAWRVAAAERAALLPTKSQHLLPGRYVTVTATRWDDPAAAVARAQAAAAAYEPAEGAEGDAPAGPLVPTLVVPVSTSAGGPGDDGDWVTRDDVDALRPMVEAALDAGVYVLLDVGAGPGPVVEQVQAAEPLLRNPGVGVAVHPESRVGDGSATTSHEMAADELQEVTDYLADLATREGLPPTMLAVHQTRPESVPDRDRLRSLPQVEVVLVADRTGGATTGEWVWNQVSTDVPEGVHLGWSGPATPMAANPALVPAAPAPVLVAGS